MNCPTCGAPPTKTIRTVNGKQTVEVTYTHRLDCEFQAFNVPNDLHSAFLGFYGNDDAFIKWYLVLADEKTSRC